jgi:hypothetical protein
MTDEEKARAKEQAKRFLLAPLPDPPITPAPVQRRRIKKIRDMPMQVYVKRAKSIRMYFVQLCKDGKVFTAGEYETVEDACRAVQEWTDKIEK